MVSNPDAYAALKSKLENLPKNVVFIASHTQTDNRKEKVSRIVVYFTLIHLNYFMSI